MSALRFDFAGIHSYVGRPERLASGGPPARLDFFGAHSFEARAGRSQLEAAPPRRQDFAGAHSSG
jgi:hypothetical protein